MNKALVMWGAVVFAVVLHLSFFRWGWSLSSGLWSVEFEGGYVWVGDDGEEHRSDHYAGLYRSQLGSDHPDASLVFGFLVPLALVGGAGYIHLGGRKA